MLNLYQVIRQHVLGSTTAIDADLLKAWQDLVQKFEARQAAQATWLAKIKEQMVELANRGMDPQVVLLR